MKWSRLNPSERRKTRETWHRWFAWHPVQIGDHMVWLEPVERKGVMFVGSSCFWEWDYREVSHIEFCNERNDQ